MRKDTKYEPPISLLDATDINYPENGYTASKLTLNVCAYLVQSDNLGTALEQLCGAAPQARGL